MSEHPNSQFNDPDSDPDQMPKEQESEAPADVAEFLRQSEEYFDNLESKSFVSDSLQERNEWKTELPPKDSADDADEPLF